MFYLFLIVLKLKGSTRNTFLPLHLSRHFISTVLRLLFTIWLSLFDSLSAMYGLGKRYIYMDFVLHFTVTIWSICVIMDVYSLKYYEAYLCLVLCDYFHSFLVHFFFLLSLFYFLSTIAFSRYNFYSTSVYVLFNW